MKLEINDTTKVQYFLVKVVDGVEVRRTEIKPTDRDEAGRFKERGNKRQGVTPDVMATCPACGHYFRVGKKQ